jgi:hypothetical protein
MNKMRRAKTITPKKSESKSRAKTGEALEKVYEQLKQILEGHAPPFKLSNGGVRGKFSVQLVVPKPVAIPGAYGGKPVELQMAAAILQKGYVGLYLMCICMNEEVKRKISPALLKLLQGKTCFHLKSLDEGLKKDIEAALALGTQAYRERGWLQP